MSNFQQPLWSNNPNAPKISYHLYVQEKASFAATLIGAILYGILIVLFFRCMTALFNSVHRGGEGINWILVSCTTAMFSFATALTGIQLYTQSICYIDNREFPGVGDALPPGPLGYQSFIFFEALSVIDDFLFFLNGWLSDGLLLYRCYVIYSKSLWAIAFPFLMYLGSLGTADIINTAMGILMTIYQAARHHDTTWGDVVFRFGLPYLSISISLNVLLTVMIVVRLIVHVRDIRTAMGGASGMGGLYKAIVTMLIESSALYAVSSLLTIVPWLVGDRAAIIFMPILNQTQVIAPLLIIQRVANRNAFTGSSDASEHIGSFRARSRRHSTGSNIALSDGYRMSSADRHRKNPGEVWVGVETTIDFHQDD